MKTLKTGESYNLTNIFSGEHNKIVIPDLQRDYCWGGKDNLVQDFVKNIIEKGYPNKDTNLQLGLLYGYEEPDGQFQLCDGQQRITTLFLLMGMLNKRCNNKFQSLLISNFEFEKDDRKPYLQYSIRENSLYFLSDLVCEFFINSKCELNEIPEQPWYFSDYDSDPSIQSIIKALNEIEELLKSPSYQEIDADDFATYVQNEIMFMYYDLGNRSSGEEAFVVINTTGEPLSATENLKPRYVTKYPDSSVSWEKWEQWFWKNRNREKNDTADNGLLEFLRWIILLEPKNMEFENIQMESEDVNKFENIQKSLVEQASSNRFDYDLILPIEPETIDGYFKDVQHIFSRILPNNKKWLSPVTINSQIEWLRILPLIAYLRKYPSATEREIIRVKHFFKNIAQISNVQKDISRILSQAVDIIRKMDSNDPDIASIINIDKISEVILSKEERLKLSIFLEVENREEVENAFWKIQYKTDENNDGKIWQGEILPIIEWSIIDGKFNYEEFKMLNNIFFEVFKGKCNSDLTRRALITQKLVDYPKYFRGSTNKSFGKEYNDWKVLINENKDKFFEFFKEIANSGVSVEESLTNMCVKFSKEENWSEFVHIPELLEYCNEKNIQWWGDNNGWILVKNKYTSGDYANVNAYKLYLELRKRNDFGNWRLWFYPKEGSCVVFDNDKTKIAIDIKCKSKDNLFDIEVFKRSEAAESYLKEYVESKDLYYNGMRYVKTAVLIDDVIEEVMELL